MLRARKYRWLFTEIKKEEMILFVCVRGRDSGSSRQDSNSSGDWDMTGTMDMMDMMDMTGMWGTKDLLGMKGT